MARIEATTASRAIVSGTTVDWILSASKPALARGRKTCSLRQTASGCCAQTCPATTSLCFDLIRGRASSAQWASRFQFQCPHASAGYLESNARSEKQNKLARRDASIVADQRNAAGPEIQTSCVIRLARTTELADVGVCRSRHTQLHVTNNQ